MTTTEERLEILRDISAANTLIQAVEGGAQALPKIARGDLGAMWIIDLAQQAGLAASWSFTSVSATMVAAGGRITSTFDTPTPGSILVGAELYCNRGNVADISDLTLQYDAGGGANRLVWAWDDGQSVVKFVTGPKGAPVIRSLLLPGYSALPFVFEDIASSTHSPDLWFSGATLGGGAGGFAVIARLWYVTLSPAQQGLDPILTTETFT